MKAIDIYGNEHEVAPDAIAWRPSVYAIIIQDGKILLSPQFGGYVLPGGAVELEETLEDALVRELKEETGLDCQPLRQIDFHEVLFIMPDEKKNIVHSLCFFYDARVVGGTVSAEFLDIEEIPSTKLAEWIDIQSLDNLRWIGSINFLAIIKDYLGTTNT